MSVYSRRVMILVDFVDSQSRPTTGLLTAGTEDRPSRSGTTEVPVLTGECREKNYLIRDSGVSLDGDEGGVRVENRTVVNQSDVGKEKKVKGRT